MLEKLKWIVRGRYGLYRWNAMVMAWSPAVSNQIRGGETEEREPFEVPLSDRCMEIIDHMEKVFPESEFIFPNEDGGPQCNLAMLRAVQRHIDRTLTNHGLRATFKTWAHEKTDYDHLVIEACLAHQVDGIERHYLRTSFPEKRRQLIQEWAGFVTSGACR